MTSTTRTSRFGGFGLSRLRIGSVTNAKPVRDGLDIFTHRGAGCHISGRLAYERAQALVNSRPFMLCTVYAQMMKSVNTAKAHGEKIMREHFDTFLKGNYSEF